MTKYQHHHCQNCGANFETPEELERHTHDCHRQQAVAGTAKNDREAKKERKNREFTRSYKE